MARALQNAGEGQQKAPSRERQRKPSSNWVAGKIQGMRQFYHDLKSEMKRVTWPTRDEVYQTTIITIVVVFFFGYYLWGTNWVLSQIVSWLIDLLSS